MKWLLPLVVFSLAGCVETQEPEGAAGVDSAPDVLECDPRQILDRTLEHTGTEQSQMEYHRFVVDPGCTRIKFNLEDDSSWVGDAEVHILSPSGLEKHLYNGIGQYSEYTGYAASGQYTSGFSMDAEPGNWHVRARGAGMFAFHVTGDIA